MAEGWYFQVHGLVQGPLTSGQLKQKADSGIIKRDTPIRKGETGKWVEAWHVNGLFTAPPAKKEPDPEEEALAYIESAGPTVAPPPIAGKPASRVAPAGEAFPSAAMRQLAPTTPGRLCPFCREPIQLAATKCKHCGEFLDGSRQSNATNGGESDKRILPLIFLFLFLGFFGIHSFYAGRVGQGLVYLLALTVLIGGLATSPDMAQLCGIVWTISLLIDFIKILSGTYKDGNKRRITKWT